MTDDDLTSVLAEFDQLNEAAKGGEHPARPDDDPEPGDRCKDCGRPITWLGPSQFDWEHTTEEASNG
jgi:hypothetical protein